MTAFARAKTISQSHHGWRSDTIKDRDIPPPKMQLWLEVDV
ncbi:MAG TPA: hypothetical protein VMY43_10725 [Methanothrix sp.]|nr:hypothetical protein [Methanothrix sp.]